MPDVPHALPVSAVGRHRQHASVEKDGGSPANEGFQAHARAPQPPADPTLQHARLPRWVRERAGRQAACDALLALGLPPVPPGRLASGAPAWPAGVLGSITHGVGHSFAAVMPRGRWHGLGIDTESLLAPAEADEVLQVCADATERRLLTQGLLAAGLAATSAQARAWAASVLFSAKEAFYKALGSTDPRAMEFSAARLQALQPVTHGPHRHTDGHPSQHTNPNAKQHAHRPPHQPSGLRLVLVPAGFLRRGACTAEVCVDDRAVHSVVLLD